MANKEKQLKLTLVRSLIGREQTHKDTIQCLGLRKIRQSVIVDSTASIHGMINKVSYLLKIEEI